jgi:hypothetical protein
MQVSWRPVGGSVRLPVAVKADASRPEIDGYAASAAFRSAASLHRSLGVVSFHVVVI